MVSLQHHPFPNLQTAPKPVWVFSLDTVKGIGYLAQAFGCAVVRVSAQLLLTSTNRLGSG